MLFIKTGLGIDDGFETTSKAHISWISCILTSMATMVAVKKSFFFFFIVESLINLPLTKIPDVVVQLNEIRKALRSYVWERHRENSRPDTHASCEQHKVSVDLYLIFSCLQV